MYNSTREASSRQEKSIARALGGRRTPNSGATKFDKSDIYVGNDWCIEAKTSMEPKLSFSVKKKWLTQLKEDKYACSKLYSALCFDFGDEKDRYYIIDENLFKQLIDYTLQDNNTDS